MARTPTSQNGWPVYTSGTHSDLVTLPRVTGRVRGGDVATVLGYVAEQFHARVEPVIKAHSWGYAYRAIRGKTSGYSNHASATAIDLNAPAHPLGASGTFTVAQRVQITAILAECGGVVRWGGTYAGRKDEMHFEINAAAAAVARVAAKLRTTPAPKPSPAPTPQEDIMATKEELAAIVKAEVNAALIDYSEKQARFIDRTDAKAPARPTSHFIVQGHAHAVAAARNTAALLARSGLDAGQVIAGVVAGISGEIREAVMDALGDVDSDRAESVADAVLDGIAKRMEA